MRNSKPHPRRCRSSSHAQRSVATSSQSSLATRVYGLIARLRSRPRSSFRSIGARGQTTLDARRHVRALGNFADCARQLSSPRHCSIHTCKLPLARQSSRKPTVASTSQWLSTLHDGHAHSDSQPPRFATTDFRAFRQGRALEGRTHPLGTAPTGLR